MNSKKAGCRLFALFVSACVLATGADWLLKRGDPQQTGWQKDEKLLTVRTVKGLRLLWTQKFSNGLTDPVLLGPIITHRGIKELVFVKDSSDTVYAVDADLGTIFWTRHLEGVTPGAPCAENSRIAPVMVPVAEKPEDPAVADDDHFSDGNRPLYVLSADGRLYALRPSTGGDFSLPRPLLPPSAKPVSLEISDNILSVAASPVCGGIPNQIWTLDLKAGANPQSRPWKGKRQELTDFDWKGKDLFAELTNSGQLVLLRDPGNVTAEPTRSGGIATWRDTAGTRWIDAASPTGIKAFQITGPEHQPAALVSWTSRGLTAAGAPVVANGVLYFLSAAAHRGENHLTLHALDALNGKELYTSSDTITSRSASGNIALANGHVCLSAADGILYCLGLPFEM